MIMLLLANTVTDGDLSASAQTVPTPTHAAETGSPSPPCRNAQGKFSIRCLPPGTVAKRAAVPQLAKSVHGKQKPIRPVADKR